MGCEARAMAGLSKFIFYAESTPGITPGNIGIGTNNPASAAFQAALESRMHFILFDGVLPAVCRAAANAWFILALPAYSLVFNQQMGFGVGIEGDQEKFIFKFHLRINPPLMISHPADTKPRRLLTKRKIRFCFSRLDTPSTIKNSVPASFRSSGYTLKNWGLLSSQWEAPWYFFRS
jgi:hypothetical protein